ncbi:MAG: hypothetical protein AAF678_07570 [Pseudomonadota bacterium]
MARCINWLYLIFFACVTACGQPGLFYRGVDPVRVTMGEDTFDVRVKGLRAEAIRLNSRLSRNVSDIRLQTVDAIEAVSGCRVAQLTGDQAVAEAALDCGRGTPARSPIPPVLDCESIDLGRGTFDVACFP